MKICIVGEGPVGLVTSLLFIYFKNKYSIADLEISLYKSRPLFERRHHINITKNMMEEIEKLISNCNNCLLHTLSSTAIDQINISINCLETILYKQLDTTHIHIFENTKFDQEHQFTNQYDHVFLCDGYQSINRKLFIYDDNNYTPIKYVMHDKVILVLYANLDATNTVINDNCIEKMSKKIIFSQDKINNSGLDFDKLIAFISLIYNTQDRYNSLTNKTKPSKNIWSSGFDNYDNFFNIFQETIDFIMNTDNGIITSTFSNFNVNITENMNLLLEYKAREMNDIFKKYKDFLYRALEEVNGLDDPFMIHSVTPNCSSHGIILDETTDNLLFAKKNNINQYCWLLGDSANGYPPGYSLMFGLNATNKGSTRLLKLLR
jgi:hypothetical protein